MAADRNTSPQTKDRSRRSAVWHFCREHPYTSLLVLGSIAVGAVAGVLIPIEEMSVFRRALGGAIAGVYFALFPLGYRLFE